jgi:DNA-binding response OmpR family regulator
MPEKILIVDDDMDTLRLVGLLLERQGYQILAANNGVQAVEMAKSNQPDLILLDLMMPDIDGYEVTKQLRAENSTTDIPIIMFTAKNQVDDKLLGFEVGADDYLTKPTQPREIIAHIKAVLTRTIKTRELTKQKDRGILIGVMAAKGGVGVTTVALNLGVALRQTTQKEIIVAEFRPGQGSLSTELGYLKPEGQNRLLQRKASEISTRSVDSELVTNSSGIRLFLSSPQPRDAKFINAIDQFVAIANQLHFMARYIVLDLGNGINPLVEKILPLCDQLITITEPVPHGTTLTKSLLEDLWSLGIDDARIHVVLVNRVRSGMQLSMSQVQEKLGHNLSTVFSPAPELAYQASLHGIPIILQQPESLPAEQFIGLAKKIVESSHSRSQ